MKKILIALPLVLVMLLSMIPVMAAHNSTMMVPVKYYSEPDMKTSYTEERKIEVPEAIAKDADKFKAFIEKEVASFGFPDAREYKVVAKVQPYVPAETKTEPVWMTFGDFQKQQGKKEDGTTWKVTVNSGDEDKFVKEGVVFNPDTNGVMELTSSEHATATPEDATTPGIKNGETTTIVKQEVAASASADVIPLCYAKKTEESKPVCLEPCSEITVVLYDVHNKKYLPDYTVVYTVDKNQAPDYQAAINLYMQDEFPYRKYQPLKNYLNVYSILTPKNIEECTIVVEVLPKWEKVQIIHELYDCCITPDGEVKKSLLSSFIEDDEAFEYTGVPDGFMGLPFLEFHTGLMVNQNKAAEYAKTRLEKMNAKDFVFDGAEFYDGIRASNWVKGVKNLKTGEVTAIKNDVPTIVIRYLRAECVKTDEKVDNAKVEAGVQTTTNAPAQQLPATGAKDITAFFMSAVALLGLGIFFAKKH